ncbi:hypothetical protein [Pseudomonas sp. YuFO8]|uniref:hypothetical protein n=1 Tax=Pseudomonas sp. YuFO8 TaxID=3095361 RepID=UPI002B240C80|nr:hypothetical protein [Pseudomonas sp. YuFO8]MEB2621393.1 hypothetical protein [Pseudomonas sp. YuFO8]
MPSFVWDRDTEDAWNEPYEYGGQEQFHREAFKVLLSIKSHYAEKDMHYDRDEKTLDKAIWLIQIDALEALVDALQLTEEKRHRVASRLFRDAVETMDISAYFYFAGDSARKDLEKWYNNEVIPHRVFREFIKKFECQDKAKNLSGLYSDLSKYTHRTHSAITKSYLLGRNNKIAYDGFSESGFRVLPHVISLSYAIIAALIKRFITIAENTQQIDSAKVRDIWSISLEEETVPRRFGPGPRQLLRSAPIEFDLKFNEG